MATAVDYPKSFEFDEEVDVVAAAQFELLYDRGVDEVH